MAAQTVIEIPYSDAEAFRRDYEADLCIGGIFVPTTDDYELRDRVTVRFELLWCGRSVELAGEIVHRIPPEMGDVGGEPGVAVQLLLSTSEVRDQLAPFALEPAPEMRPLPGDTRRDARKAARVAARVEWNGQSLTTTTRNLSRSGVLIETPERDIPIGETVTVKLSHPFSGETFSVFGKVVRHVMGDGRAVAVGIAFEMDRASRTGVSRFIEEVMGSEHTRRLGAISGSIAELGPHNTVQMLAQSAPGGTIVLRREEEEGILCFENGLLVSARLAGLSGMDAVVELLSWREGTFEFNTRIDEADGQAPIPLEAAILEAVRRLDERARVDTRSFPLQARLARGEGDGSEEDAERSTIEAALLDLASAGFTVSRALEVIPESDDDIFRAMQRLIDLKELELR